MTDIKRKLINMLVLGALFLILIAGSVTADNRTWNVWLGCSQAGTPFNVEYKYTPDGSPFITDLGDSPTFDFNGGWGASYWKNSNITIPSEGWINFTLRNTGNTAMCDVFIITGNLSANYSSSFNTFNYYTLENNDTANIENHVVVREGGDFVSRTWSGWCPDSATYTGDSDDERDNAGHNCVATYGASIDTHYSIYLPSSPVADIPAGLNFTANKPSPLKFNDDNFYFYYNLSLGTYSVKQENISLFYNLSDQTNKDYIFINGTPTRTKFTNASSNITTNFTFNIDDENFFPASYNLDHAGVMEIVDHTINSISSTNLFKIRFFNVLNNNAGNESVIELMANNSNSASGQDLEVFYCNETYINGNPDVNTNCLTLFNVPAQSPYNHTDTTKSKHINIPFPIQNGFLNGVKVTNTSYFVLRAGNGINTWNAYSVPNISRADTIQSSNNGGTSWSNFAGTIDAHIHFRNGNTNLSIIGQVCDTAGNCRNETAQTFAIFGVDRPPTSVNFAFPIASDNFNTGFYINWTNSTPFGTASINNYRVNLVDNNEVFVSTIKLNNGLNTSVFFDITGVTDGVYRAEVITTDSNGLTSESHSINFSIDTSDPTITSVFPDMTNSSLIQNTGGNLTINVTFADSRDLFVYNITMLRLSDSFQIFNQSAYIGGTSQTITRNVGMQGLNNESYILQYRTCDSHTAQDIGDRINHIGSTDRITFQEGETLIYVRALDEYVSDSKAFKDTPDRLKFRFKYHTPTPIKSYILESNQKIIYIPSSEYKAHFVIDGRIWTDFEQDGNVIVTKINDTAYRIEVDNAQNTIVFNSMGFLNCVERHYTFALQELSVSTSKYNIGLIGNNLFNQDAFDTSTTAGILAFFFIVFLWIGLTIFGFYTKIPAVAFFGGIFGFFTSLLVYVSLSAILGILLIAVSLMQMIFGVVMAKG